MRSEPSCEDIRLELSARLDGEVDDATSARLDEHLETCEGCRAHEQALRAVRTQLRIRLSDETVPDLTAAVMARVSAERQQGSRGRASGRWGEVVGFRIRVAAVAAAAMALVVFGATLPFLDSPSDVASASQVSQEVRAAARMLDSYEATFDIVERGWHEDIGARRLSAQVWFRAPEDIRIRVSDETTYPSDEWPTNDYELIASARRWWIEERSACPTEGLPACPRPYLFAGRDPLERRAVVNRQPFDGTTPLPTDIVVPLVTLTSSSGMEVLGETEVTGRPAVRVRLDHRRAQPLVGTLQVGGSWREFHPLDVVDVWLDAETYFPLRFEVRAGTSPDRSLWALRRSLADRPGEVLLEVAARSFQADPELNDSLFSAPRSGFVRDGGFRARAASGAAVVDVPAGLRPYRAGRLGNRRVRSYAGGLTYLKVVTARAGSVEIAPEAEELETAVGFMYYLPGSPTSPGGSAGRRIDIIGDRTHVTLESNLTRNELIEVAATADLRGRRAPTVLRRSTGTVVTRSQPAAAYRRFPFALRPRFLPPGYDAATAVLTTGRDAADTIVVYYRHHEFEFEGSGIRIAQSAPVGFLTPSSEEFFDVSVRSSRGDSVVGRWSPERGELEWIDGGVYRAVAVPSSDLATALRIANELR